MKATEANLLEFLQSPQQFVIPIYQRTYSWTLAQCQQLWNDIRNAATNPAITAHFVGSIVYIKRSHYQVSEKIPQQLVIDGQQRLTTITLLLTALRAHLEKQSGDGLEMPVSTEEINDYYLFNKHGKDERRYKLLLTQSDRETLIHLVEGHDRREPFSRRMIENYDFFRAQLSKSNVDLARLYQGISKLLIVDISLNRDHDNPQLIFESLNSTGLDLSQADLVRNYVLMGLEPQEQDALYNNYWYPMEQSFGHGEYSSYFDRFMRDYLTVRTGRIPNLGDVYAEFKSYVRGTSDRTMQQVVADVYSYSQRYVRIAFAKAEDKEINTILRDINILKVDVAYPFLLELYDDYDQGRLTREEFIEALKLVESYVFRRAICGIPTNSLNKTFATLGRELDKSRYLESVKAAFLLKDSYRRFPNDEEFSQQLLIKDVYNFRNRNYLLRKLENYNRKESVDVESYTIEHIMPQNEELSHEWQQELGDNWRETHAKYLHTIGNLTLTGYNSELSDRPFQVKRDMEGGFRDSPIRLNRRLANLEHWNEEEIKNRAEDLAGIAIKVWSHADLPPQTLAEFRKASEPGEKQEYTIETHARYLQGSMLELFESLRKRILNLDASVREEFKKLYIAYKTTTNFVDIIPQKSRLLLSLNLDISEIVDPKVPLKDVANQGRWGNGDVEVGLSSHDQLEDVMALVRQAFEKQAEDGGA